MKWIILRLIIWWEVWVVLWTNEISRYLIFLISKWVIVVGRKLSIVEVNDCRFLTHKLLFESQLFTLRYLILTVFCIVDVFKSRLRVEFIWIERAFLLQCKFLNRSLFFREYIIWNRILLKIWRNCYCINCCRFFIFELNLLKIVIFNHLIF